jgi:hypothetical protein
MAAPTLSAARAQVRGFWDYYWIYARTRVGVHGAATAGLTAFGLLMYFNRWFVIPAIVVYLLPPVYLYLIGDTPKHTRTHPSADETEPDADTDVDDGDTDTDADGTDTDTDGLDADADADGADVDADADGADADADVDR